MSDTKDTLALKITASFVIAFMILLWFAESVRADCNWAWADHDYDSMTPPVRIQLCDGPLDMEVYDGIPSVEPIQYPQIEPLVEPGYTGVAPIGFSSCENVSVWSEDRNQWVDQVACQ